MGCAAVAKGGMLAVSVHVDENVHEDFQGSERMKELVV
jgi:hypothetical protein